MRPITLEMLAIRLASVRKAVGNDQQPVTAVINGREVGLSVTNFQIDDQGRLLISGISNQCQECNGIGFVPNPKTYGSLVCAKCMGRGARSE